MSFSKENFIDDYISETNEHLDNITKSILILKESPHDAKVISEILRQLHTIKGISRMLDFLTVESLSHGLEDVFKAILEDHFDFSENILKLTLNTIDQIKRILSRIKTEHDDKTDITLFLDTIEKASLGLFFNPDILEADSQDSFNLIDDSEGNGNAIENITSIRINLNRINEIIRSFDNLIIRQFRFKHDLEKFEKKLKKTDGKIHELPRQLKEDLSLTENAVFDIQHLILNMRMLPLNIVLNPLRREIEKDAISLNKNIHFDIPETDLMLDKTILEQLKEILMHLVRNSIDHGIESPEERIKLGKKEDGLISISTAQTSNHLVITVSDDGRGIQYDKIRAKASEVFPEAKDRISVMDEKELQQYLFEPGFSTSETPTSLSGRGLGLDIVRTTMKKIKGKIQIQTAKEQGTTFKLTMPLSLATQQGLFVTTGNMRFMIPSHYIHEIIDGDKQNILSMQGQNFLCINNQFIPIHYLSTVFGGQRSDSENAIIVLEYLETQIAVIVKTIEEYENVVVTSLPSIMKDMNSLQGVVYDDNYSIIPILNIPDIMQRLRGLLGYDLKKYKIKNEKKVYTILIVDDSLMTQQIEQSIFESDSYVVKTASDGIEALDQLKSFRIDAIVTDINMPRMDGATLLSNIRRMEEYNSIPVIVVSGAYDPEEKSRFIEAGAQAFIVKSQFQRGNLLQAVKELLGD